VGLQRAGRTGASFVAAGLASATAQSRWLVERLAADGLDGPRPSARSAAPDRRVPGDDLRPDATNTLGALTAAFDRR
jgi:hypothetical protein